ncbi:glycosyltransferase [Enterovirga sp. CN4-39]|uniref:glycosyltransferase n=1 Tax=Enterovirga sp. CN4-39 TaxID=3400910 RepID=UPI003C03D22F
MWQRPQHLLSRAAADFDVVFFEEPVWRDDIAAAELEITRRPGDIRVATPHLPHGVWDFDAVMAQRRLLERFLASEPTESRVFWYYTPMAMAFSGHLQADAVIYDNMDELSAFRGASPEMLSNEEDLFARADLVFTGGMSLYEAKRHRHPSVHPFPSSIDPAHFARARIDRRDPPDQAGIPGPRLGFFGVIDERMDLDLVAGVADARPDWQVVMIGPVVKIDPETLPQRPNIHWLGGRTYDELPAYLSGWNIGFMPFALNESTRFISPTKTPEFLAAGVPVISTPITDVIRPYGKKGLVEIAETKADVVAAAERLMARPRAQWLARIDRHLATGSWDATWAAMRRLVSHAMGEPELAAGSANLAGAPAPLPAE